MIFSRESKTPTILQMEASECGAAALGIILAHYKLFIALEELRANCGVSRNGSKAANVLKAAREYGMNANAAEADIEGLQSLNSPCIAFWNFNHFIVVEEITNKHAYINDPATGPRKISIDQFSAGFTGVILLIEPGEDFKAKGSPLSIISWLRRRLKGEISGLSFALIAGLLLVLPGIVIPGFTKVFIDYILLRGYENWITPLLFSMAIAAALQGGLIYLQRQCLLRMQIKLMLSGTMKFIWHLFQLPAAFFYQRFAGDIYNRLNSNMTIANLLSSELSSAVLGAVSMIAYLIVMFMLSWSLTLIGLLATIMNASLLLFVYRKVSDLSQNVLQKEGRLSGVEMYAMRSIETIKATATENNFFQRWAGNHAEIMNMEYKLSLYSQFLTILPTLLTGITGVAILSIGSFSVLQGTFTVGSLVAFQMLLANFNAPLSTLLGMGYKLIEVKGHIARLDDVLQCEESPEFSHENQATKKNIRLQGTIELNNVSFGYSSFEAPIIPELSFLIRASEHVAIIGKTGDGKSTILKLLLGLYQPWTGSVTVDEQPLASYSRECLSRNIAYVSQHIFLFEGSLRDNLTLWRNDLSDECLLNALKIACLDDIFFSSAHLDTPITEQGLNLSGGQRQRVELARALAIDPSILILDEATANIDAIMEKKIYQNLKEQQCTTILVTHRLDAITDCDTIMVMENGCMVEHGNHQTLLDKKGIYYNYLDMDGLKDDN